MLAFSVVPDISWSLVKQRATTPFRVSKAAAMDHKISVTVHVDLDGRNVRIVVTGCLTEFSQRALHPLIRRARTLTPTVEVTVDLTRVRHLEPLGLDLLRQAVDQDGAGGTRSPVHLVVAQPSRSQPVPPPGARPAARPGTGAGGRIAA